MPTSTNKRRGVLSVPPLTIPPLADGTIDQFDRKQAAYTYPLGAGGAGPPPGPATAGFVGFLDFVGYSVGIPGAGPGPEPEAPAAARRKGAAVRIIDDWWRLEDDELFVILQ